MALCKICSNITFRSVRDARLDGTSAQKKRSISLSDAVLLRLGKSLRRRFACEEDRDSIVAFLHPSFEALKSSVAEGRNTHTICQFCEVLHEILLQTETRRRLRAQCRPGLWTRSGFFSYLDTVKEEEDGIAKPLNVKVPSVYKRTQFNHAMRKGQAVWLRCSASYLANGSWKKPRFVSVGAHGMEESGALFIVPPNWPSQFPTAEKSGESLPDAAQSAFLGLDKGTDSVRATMLTRNWVNYCSENHAFCGRRGGLYALPTRLLDVKPEGKVSEIALVDGNSIRSSVEESYVTLSHRWGNYQPIRTTTGNEGSHRDGIQISALPKTFQDAVRVVKAHGIRYLWIDTLCIIRDSEADQAKEFSVMGGYYYNARFNISAESAADCRVGLFYARNGAALRPQSLVFHHGDDPSLVGRWTVTPRLDAGSSMRRAGSVLNDRGWIFQKQVLARRTLHYRWNSISFSCYSHFASENLPGGVPFQALTSPYITHQTASESLHIYNDVHSLGVKMQAFRMLDEDCTGSPSDTERDQLWYRAVQQYSHRSLTKEEDRLEAISGLAERLGASCQDYVAGLWKSDLLAGLC